MKKNVASILVLFLVLFSINVMAMDRLITIPTADLVGGEGFIAGEILGSSYRQLEGSYNLNSALSIGGIISSWDNNQESELGVLAKTILVQETKDRPAISAGIRKKDLYFVTSKEVALGIRGHVGIGNGDFGGLFLGLNKVLNPVSISQGNKPSMPIINLMGEYANEEVNIGLRMNLQDNMKLDLGLLDFEDFKIGLGYLF